MDHLSAKRRIGAIAGAVRSRPDRRVILIYHAVDSGPLSLSGTNFREQMAWLAENARVCSLDALLDDVEGTGLRVALTFDDGYESLHRVAAPLLRSLNFAATAYLSTACIGERDRVASDLGLGHYPSERFLLWDEVERMREMGWTMASHGCDHLDLTVVPEDVARAQMIRSKAELEARLGGRCGHFAYTFGNFNRRISRLARECGYDWAVSAIHGPVTRGFDRYAVPRIDVRKDYELSDFVAVLRGDWDYLGLVQRARLLFR